MTNLSGQQLGNYHLVSRLGSGSFGEVYLGEHIHLNTQAAVKVLYTHLVSDDLKDFHNEARTIARLKHPHIVQVFDAEIKDGVPFFIMQYAPHGTLRDHYPKHTQLSLDNIVFYIKQIAEGLQYAHDSGVIHRDIKPENMLVEQDNKILLSDFGLAIIAQSSRYQQGSQDTGGTIAYMAPEQLQGKPHRASDQYALGVVAYEWLTGECPFHGLFLEIASQHLLFPPPPFQKELHIPSSVENIVQKALAKDLHARFASVKDFALALEQAWQEEEERLRREREEEERLRRKREETALESIAVKIEKEKKSPISLPVKPTLGITDGPIQPKEHPSPLLKWPILVLTLILVSSLVIGGGVWLSHTGKPPVPTPVITHTPLSQATIAATPTPDTLLTAEAGPPAYQNVLTSASTQKGDWQNDRYCFFASDGYHVAFAGAFAICHQSGKVPYQDVTISIDMLLNGGTGALLFRDQGTFGKVGAYVFELAANGRYKISVLTSNQGTIINRPLLDWTFSTALHQGLKVVNTLQIITIGNDFLFYMNGIYLTRRTDKSYIDGGISLACYDSGEAIFSNLYVYYR